MDLQLALKKALNINILLSACALCLVAPWTLPAAEPAKRLRANITDSETFVLKGNTRPAVTSAIAQDLGPVSGSQPMPRMSLHFNLTAAQQKDLTQLLADQQNRRSPQYRKFLTPEEYASRFGMNSADIAKVSAWLENSGFSNVQVARGKTSVSFTGTAAQAQAIFHTAIHNYSLNGQPHIANATDPELPKALNGIVASVRGLHDFHMKPQIQPRLQPHYTAGSGTTYIAPDDWETIYDVKPLYSAGLDGSPISGQTYSIVVVGQSDVQLSDLQAFRTAAGLSTKNPTIQIPTGESDPGLQASNGDEAESDLDLEWAGAIAKNANILFVTSSGGAESSIAYAIDNNVAPILTTSYGSCEADLSASEFSTDEALFAQAAAQGMTVVAASGDAGAADCDTGNLATHGLAVKYPASSVYVTGIGGTELTSQGSGTYWSSTNNSSNGSALSYIPEVAWNDANQAATGGGVSILETKPSWQTGIGVPNDGHRDVPDLAFAASIKQDGLVLCSAGSCANGFLNSSSAVTVTGGTSAGSATFAGVLAMLVQATGTHVGLLNPNLYSLVAISGNAFHDVTAGNNQVLCQGGTTNCPATSSTQTGLIGYVAGVGYDLTTGWGSIDSYNFVEQWSGDIQLTSSPTSISILPGSSGSATVTVAPVKNFSGPVSFACSVSSALANVTCSVPSTTVNTSGSTTVTVTAGATARTLPLHRPFMTPPPSPVWPVTTLALALAIYTLRKQGSLTSRLAYTRSAYTWSAAGFLVLTLGAVSCGSGTSSGALSLTCSLPNTAEVGIAFNSEGGCVPSGGKSPYTYSITAGTLPPGLSLAASSGVLSGTPTTAGTYTFNITATDSSSTAQTSTYPIVSFTVLPPPIENGVVTVTATSGGITNSIAIPVTVQ